MILANTENTPAAWSERAATPDPWSACGWTQDGQADRFDAVLDELDPQPGDRLLDWGCGTGVLADLVAPSVEYVGFDSAVGMVERARRDHPDRRFQTFAPTGNFDLVACVGPFNLPGHWSKQMTWYTLRRLFEQTLWAAERGRKARLVASVYAGSDPRCLSYTIEECDRFAKGQGFRAFADKWRHNDILIVLER